ncbi:MAG: BBP7 family outer membrane beta-barrel protein [Gemmataceae bacterium]
MNRLNEQGLLNIIFRASPQTFASTPSIRTNPRPAQRAALAMRKAIFCLLIFSSTGESLSLAQTPVHSPYGEVQAASAEGNQQAVTPAPNGKVQPTPPSAAILDGGASCIGDACEAARQVCGPPGRVWASAEYLLWWTKGDRLPPLVTTGPANAALPGSIGAPGTTTIFGNTTGNSNPVSGGRFTIGFWLNCRQTIGIEADYFFLGDHSSDFTATSTGAAGTVVLARPFLDASTGLQNIELVAFPGLVGGTINVNTASRIQSPEANLIFNLCCSCPQARCDCCDCCGPVGGYRIDLIGGFRYLDLRERLSIVESLLVSPNAPVFPGDTIVAIDQFDTRNQFYGPQIGARAEVWRNRWFVNVMGKVAMGVNHQTVDISGSTTVTTPAGAVTVLPGGLLALPSNIGHYERNRFSVVPELNANVGIQATEHLRLFVGYTFLYWNHVVRPSDVIDTQVNSTRTPLSLVPPTGPLRPQFVFRDSDYWAQGINFGLQLRY